MLILHFHNAKFLHICCWEQKLLKLIVFNNYFIVANINGTKKWLIYADSMYLSLYRINRLIKLALDPKI